jgi:hypothetical protein
MTYHTVKQHDGFNDLWQTQAGFKATTEDQLQEKSPQRESNKRMLTLEEEPTQQSKSLRMLMKCSKLDEATQAKDDNPTLLRELKTSP